MEPIARISSSQSENSPISMLLANLTSDNATRYSAEFTVYRQTTINPSPDSVKFSLSLCRSPFHSWSQSGKLRKYTEVSNCYVQFSRSLSRIEDSDLPFQIVQALGRIPGLAHVKFSFSDCSHSSHSETSKLDEFERLVPAFFESICSPRRSMKQIVFRIFSTRQLLSTSFPILSRCCTLERLEINARRLLRNAVLEDDAKRIASFLRNNKSLKSVSFTLMLVSWQISPALEVVMEHLAKSKIDAVKSAEHKNGDHSVLQKLDLVLEFCNFSYGSVAVDPVEAVKIMRLMFNAGSSVGQLSLSMRSCRDFNRKQTDQFEYTMRMEHGAQVELDVPACSEIGGEVVVEALLLNRGPGVLSLGPLQPPLLRKILSLLVPDQNGQQANTCVSTLKLLNIADDKYSGTLELQQERLAEVANMMKLNSTVKHLEVTKFAFNFSSDPPQCNSDSPVVTQLHNTSTTRGNLQSLKFYGKELYNSTASSNQIAEADAKKQQENKQEVVKVVEVEKVKKVEKVEKVEKVQCRKYLKPDQEMVVVVTMKKQVPGQSCCC